MFRPFCLSFGVLLLFREIFDATVPTSALTGLYDEQRSRLATPRTTRELVSLFFFFFFSTSGIVGFGASERTRTSTFPSVSSSKLDAFETTDDQADTDKIRGSSRVRVARYRDARRAHVPHNVKLSPPRVLPYETLRYI